MEGLARSVKASSARPLRARPAAYVLEPDGTVLAVVEKVDTKDHAAQLRAVLKGL